MVSTESVSETETSVGEGLSQRLSGWPVGNWLMDGPWLSNGLVDGSGVVELGKGKGQEDEFLLSLEEESKTGQLLQLLELPSGNLGIAFGSERHEHEGNGGHEEEECGETHFDKLGSCGEL